MARSADDPPHGKDSRRRSLHRTRLIMIAAVCGALVVLGCATALGWGGSAGSGGWGQDNAPGSAAFQAPPGSCLDWHRADTADVRQVACAEPHLFEVTGTTEVADAFPPDAPYPDDHRWQQLKQRCVPVSTGYLRSDLDPAGRFRVGAFTPNPQQWDDGDRTLHCGIQQPSVSGELFRGTGSAAGADQSDIYQPGTCLGIDAEKVTDPIACSRPHAVEMTGVVDLSQHFSKGPPSEHDQDAFLTGACAKLTADYAGGPDVVPDKKLAVFWDTLSAESWNAGSHRVNCKAGSRLPGQDSLAPVTGGLRGQVTIGNEPVRDERTFHPGAPAEGTR